MPVPLCALFIIAVTFQSPSILASWNDWWSYEGFSGANYWGLINPDWAICSTGKYQSPVDIDLSKLTFDSRLNSFSIVNVPKSELNQRIYYVLVNDGHNVVLYPKFEAIGTRSNNESSLKISENHGDPMNKNEPDYPLIKFSSGPLVYEFRIFKTLLHYGSHDTIGSEHSLNGQSFPAELQIYTYNTDLYDNSSLALVSVNGISIISFFVQVSNKTTPFLSTIIDHSTLIEYKDSNTTLNTNTIVDDINSLFELGPDGNPINSLEYVTYHGSLTVPPCTESVIWIIMNKPLLIKFSDVTIPIT